jgi:hypothetical protein
MPEIIAQTLKLVDNSTNYSWPATLAHVHGSGGAIHLRQMIVCAMSATQQSNLARATSKLGITVSVEAGGAMCGGDSGAAAGKRLVTCLTPFFAAGGSLSFLAQESIFSRTHAGCKTQSQAETATEVAAFSSAIKTGLTAAGASVPAFFLYDALPHMTVGKWPANVPTYGMDLGEILGLLDTAMAKLGVTLAGYWLDCPYEYSRDYPNATAPLPAGSGFQKVAAAAALVRARGLKVGKTFNSQMGGQTSDELFFTSTLADWDGAQAAGATFDYAMVETWYYHPVQAAPEAALYTTTYTAKALFDKATAKAAVVAVAGGPVARRRGA